MKTEEILNESTFNHFSEMIDKIVELSSENNPFNLHPNDIEINKSEIERQKRYMLDFLGFNLVSMEQIREMVCEFQSYAFQAGGYFARGENTAELEKSLHGMREKLLNLIDRFGNRCNWGMK